MTRVNANIPMHKLSDQLLLNELGEITRILYNVEQRINKEQDFNNIPESFTLGKGHMTFFYDKCKFIFARYLKLRGHYFNRNGKDYSEEHLIETLSRCEFIKVLKPELYNDWVATSQDNKIVLDRIYERSKGYKKQHTYYGKPINNWHRFLFEEKL